MDINKAFDNVGPTIQIQIKHTNLFALHHKNLTWEQTTHSFSLLKKDFLKDLRFHYSSIIYIGMTYTM